MDDFQSRSRRSLASACGSPLEMRYVRSGGRSFDKIEPRVARGCVSRGCAPVHGHVAADDGLRARRGQQALLHGAGRSGLVTTTTEYSEVAFEPDTTRTWHRRFVVTATVRLGLHFTLFTARCPRRARNDRGTISLLYPSDRRCGSSSHRMRQNSDSEQVPFYKLTQLNDLL